MLCLITSNKIYFHLLLQSVQSVFTAPKKNFNVHPCLRSIDILYLNTLPQAISSISVEWPPAFCDNGSMCMQQMLFLSIEKQMNLMQSRHSWAGFDVHIIWDNQRGFCRVCKEINKDNYTYTRNQRKSSYCPVSWLKKVKKKYLQENAKSMY